VALRQFLATHGITHLTTPPHIPEHNGLGERKHRHIVETGLTLMSTASVPKQYWTYAFSTVVYLNNRMPTAVLSMQSPFHKLFESPPNYEKLRVFGCLCFPWLRPYTQNKLDDRSQRCVFLGYYTSQSAYLCLHLPTNRVYFSRHVQFNEEIFPFKQPESHHCENESVQPSSLSNIFHLRPAKISSSPITVVSLPTTNSTAPHDRTSSSRVEVDDISNTNVGQIQLGPTLTLNSAQTQQHHSTHLPNAQHRAPTTSLLSPSIPRTRRMQRLLPQRRHWDPKLGSSPLFTTIVKLSGIKLYPFFILLFLRAHCSFSKWVTNLDPITIVSN